MECEGWSTRSGDPLERPNFVELAVTRTDPACARTATGATKPATLETGATCRSTLFIEEGK